VGKFDGAVVSNPSPVIRNVATPQIPRIRANPTIEKTIKLLAVLVFSGSPPAAMYLTIPKMNTRVATAIRSLIIAFIIPRSFVSKNALTFVLTGAAIATSPIESSTEIVTILVTIFLFIICFLLDLPTF
jgi:hypothetical protein